MVRLKMIIRISSRCAASNDGGMLARDPMLDP
jgi:hypothetical protein